MEADMQQELYADHITVEYEGMFSYPELLKLINDWAQEKKYYKEIANSKEKVTKTGKNITVEFTFQRRIVHLYRSQIELTLEIEDMKDTQEKVDGQMKNLNYGKVTAVANGYTAASLSGRWEQKGYIAFIKGVIDKFIYKIERPELVALVVRETKDVIFKIRGFLNSYPTRLKGRGTEAIVTEGRKPEAEKARELP